MFSQDDVDAAAEALNDVRFLIFNIFVRVVTRPYIYLNKPKCDTSMVVFQMPIKRLYMVVEMAAQGESGGSAEAIYSGKDTIKMSHFYECLQDIVRY